MLNKIEQWIDKTNTGYINQRICCDCFSDDFEGFYPVSFLKQSYFVTVSKIPKPDFPELREMGLGKFIDMPLDGITYKNTYYILSSATRLTLHFHELVHVAQWEHLGAINFIRRYIEEIKNHSYKDAPLEKMAYDLEDHYKNGGKKIDIPSYVSKNI